MALSRHTEPFSWLRPILGTVAVLATTCLGGVAGVQAARRSRAEVGDEVRRAVVKVYVTSQSPNQAEPWQTGTVGSGSGSGCVLSGNRILTAAHVVERQTYLQVRRQGDTRVHDARVLFVAHDVDLALLTAAPEFFAGIEPLELGPLPPVQAGVVALGFPTGGDTLSLTEGVVSRVEHSHYSHSGGTFLAMQVDAAINAGNSGGPVVAGGRLVGVAFQGLSRAQNISYAVPSPVISRFLADVQDGRYDGVPELGVEWQPLANPAMRARYGASGEAGGVLVRAVVPGTDAAATLRPGDVLLSIEGTVVGEDGTVEFRPGERTSFAHLVDGRQRGSAVDLVFLREGVRREARVRLTARHGDGRLVPLEDHESAPQYLVFGGIVLRPLTLPYICSFGSEWWKTAPDEFLAIRDKVASFEGEGLVAITNVFPDAVNQGYQDFGGVTVTAIDGVRPKNFVHAVELIEGGRGEFLTLGLSDTNTMVLRRDAARARNAAILERYHLPFDRSADLRPAVQRAGAETAPASASRSASSESVAGSPTADSRGTERLCGER